MTKGRRGRAPKLGVKLDEYFAFRTTKTLLNELEEISKMVDVPAPVITRHALYLFLEALGRGDAKALAWVKQVKEQGEVLH